MMILAAMVIPAGTTLLLISAYTDRVVDDGGEDRKGYTYDQAEEEAYRKKIKVKPSTIDRSIILQALYPKNAYTQVS